MNSRNIETANVGLTPTSENHVHPDYWNNFSHVVSPAAFNISRLKVSDDVELTIYEAGTRSSTAILIINPPGAPFIVLAKLAQELSKKNYVISWENRGSPYNNPDDDFEYDLSLNRQALDVREILQNKEVTTVVVFTLCLSSLLLPSVLTRLAAKPKAILCFAASLDYGFGRSPIQLFFDPIIQGMADNSLVEAGKAYDAYRAYKDSSPAPADRIMKEISELSLLSTRTFALARQMAKMTGIYESHRDLAQFEQCCNQTPTLFMHCQDDPFIPVENSKEACRKISTATSQIYPDGGHLLSYVAPDVVAKDINAYLDKLPA